MSIRLRKRIRRAKAAKKVYSTAKAKPVDKTVKTSTPKQSVKK